MKRLWMSGAAAVMAISIAGVSAQTPQTQPPTQQPPTTQPPATQRPMAQPPATTEANMQSTTIQGCVYKEEAVPGRTPNVAEQAGVLEDYILVPSANTSATATGTSGAAMPPAATAGTGTTAGATTGHKAFKLENIADERLRAVVGKRVEVTGRVDAEDSDKNHAAGAAGAHGTAGAAGTHGTAGAPARDRSLGPDKIELPEFEVTAMREVEGTCPATPSIRK